MASEVINAVLGAEKAAADSYADTVGKCDSLKAEALEKAKSIEKEMKDEALSKAKEIKAKAEAKAAELQDEAGKNAAAQAAKLKADALGKSDGAVKALLSELI